MGFYVGLDLGQVNDPSAVVVVEQTARSDGRCAYQCRHAERLPLGTPYPEIVQQVQQLLQLPALRGHSKLVCDATGVGRPVVDMFKQASLQPIAVLITSGNTVSYDRGFWLVPKRDLVATVQVLLQSERLKFAQRVPEVQTLIRELLNFQVKITDAANDTYGAWREGQHDDLALALCLAVWAGERFKQTPTDVPTASGPGWAPVVPTSSGGTPWINPVGTDQAEAKALEQWYKRRR